MQCNFGTQLNNTGGECRVCPNATCPKRRDEVCGSNSITYNSACELYREACQKRTTSLYVFKKGACGKYNYKQYWLACMHACMHTHGYLTCNGFRSISECFVL